jgi:hypothetical protein
VTRGAPLTVLDDPTALDGPDIDVSARIGWVLRMARLTSQRRGVTRLDTMARALGTNSTRLHRAETGLVRDGGLIDAYERALGRPVGSLRAPVDVLCRTFRSAPRDRDGGPRVTTVQEMSALTDAVEGPDPTGGDWLAWSRALSQAGAIGMPVRQATVLVGRLVSELHRSVGPAYPSRYEALAQLRCGPYGGVVLDVARAEVADPDVQVLFDLMSAVGEHVGDDAVAWTTRLLSDPRENVVIGAVLALENMAEIVGPDFWYGLVDPLTERYNATRPGSVHWEWMSHLLRLIPHRLRAATPVAPRHPPAFAPRIENWSRSRLNTHWSDCQRRAHAVTDSLGLSDQPMLARLLFDIAVSPHESRAVTGYMLLGALPAIAEGAGDQLADLAAHHPDPLIRSRAGRRLAGCLMGRFPDLAKNWLDGEDHDERVRALHLAGAAGWPVPEDLLEREIAARGSRARAALYAAGMAGQPIVRRLADAPARCRTEGKVQGAARWWLRHGSRVVA